MSQELINKCDILADRAQMLAKARHFFAMRGVMEVDVPILSPYGSIDVHIDLVEAKVCGQKGYLHSSPEYGMKQLLSYGCKEIYQLSHVFRDGERGSRHHPEFSMCEWYRSTLTFEELIEETLAFLQLFLPKQEVEVLTYGEAFLKYAGRLPEECADEDHVLAFEIEPKMGREGFTVIRDFPLHKAALAKRGWKEGKEVVQRFEIYCQGLELANGYDELIDPEEQRKRLETNNRERAALHKPLYPVDHDFLEALKRGVPSCVGVAVGFDRLMMLRHNTEEIKEILPL